MPNIVLIFVDDMGYADIEPFSATKQKTPNLDRNCKKLIPQTLNGEATKQKTPNLDRTASEGRKLANNPGESPDVASAQPHIVAIFGPKPKSEYRGSAEQTPCGSG